MADSPVKLVKGTGSNFASTGTTTLNLPFVRDLQSRKSANLINIPLPGSDSTERIAFDLLGVTREISFSGEYVSGATSSIENFTTDLDNLVFGGQGNTSGGQVGYICTIPQKASTFRVFVNDANWTMRQADPETVEYSVTLYEVSSSSG